MNVGDISVHLIGHHAGECHVAPVNDDVNWRDGLQTIAIQSRVAINCPVFCQSNAVVICGGRQHLNVVRNAFHPFDAFHYILRIRFERGARYRTFQFDIVPVDFVTEIVKDAVVREEA